MIVYPKYKPYLKTVIGLTILVTTLALYAILVEPNVISLNVVNILDNDLARIFHNKKIIQISDLHITSAGYREKKLIKMLNQIGPDLLFITGDFLTDGIDENSCIDILGRIKMPRYGIWAVLGNADRYKDDESNQKMDGFVKRLTDLGIRVLRNSCEPLVMGDSGERVFVAGVEGPYLSRSKLEWLLSSIPADAPVILLSHYPDILENHADALVVNLEEAEGQGVLGWGWQDNAFFEHHSGIVRFEQDGQHNLRVQRREDGVSIERICLVPLIRQNSTLTSHFKNSQSRKETRLTSSNISYMDNSDVVNILSKDISDSNIFGSWKKTRDENAGINPVLKDASNSDEKNEFPLAKPEHYFEANFYAKGGVDYRVFVRMKAENDSISNDSVYIQFSDGINQKGEPIFRIGKLGIRSGLKKINLILAGHTHGGQIRFSVFGALDIVPYHKINYEMGLFQSQGTQMYVNRGIGTVLLPMRFLCLPEITTFEFSKKRE